MQGMQKIQVFNHTNVKTYLESTLVKTLGDVQHIKNELELRSGIKLDLNRPTHFEISLTCHNLEKYQCGLKYLFRKTHQNPENSEYLLHTQFQSHHLECISEASGSTKPKYSQISSPSFKRYKPQEIQHSPESSSLKFFKLPSKSESFEKTQNLERSLAEQCLSLQVKHSGKFYTEGKKVLMSDEVGSLKKQLQFQSKGLISKSTEFHPEFGYVSKIAFKCKFENNNCPYLSTLTYSFQRNAKNQKLYKLQKINPVHNNLCLLDEEEVHFNFITRKIDENFQLLISIIQKNTIQVKPKRVLELFAQELGEQPDFIYKGIESKHNRRAAKKYFDNSVAKARTQLK